MKLHKVAFGGPNIGDILLNIDSFVSDYQNKILAIREAETTHQSNIDRVTLELRNLEVTFSAKHFLLKVLTFIPFKIKHWSLEAIVDENQHGLKTAPKQRKDALKKLVLEAGRELMVTGHSAAQLELLEKEHRELKALSRSAENVHQAGVKALSQIRSAIDDIESAQTMEVLDGFTDSKAISTLSTVQNFSASDAVDDARRAINQFKSKLDDHHELVSTPEHSTTIELIDFTFDIFFGGVLDVVGSVLSYLALSDAENQLRNALNEVEKAVSPLSEQCKAIREKVDGHEKALFSFKTEGRAQVIPILAEKGITVSADLLSSITELYAPSVR